MKAPHLSLARAVSELFQALLITVVAAAVVFVGNMLIYE
jgi:hypothetical protein